MELASLETNVKAKGRLTNTLRKFSKFFTYFLEAVVKEAVLEVLGFVVFVSYIFQRKTDTEYLS